MDFVYDLLKLQKKLELGMSEKAIVDHIFVKLEPQVQDYVKVRNPQNAIRLLEVLAKFVERYPCKATLGSRNSDNVEGRGWNEHRMSNVGNNRGNWRNSEVTRLLRKRYGTLERRNHLYRRRHTKNIFYKQVKKSSTQVITAQGAKCQNIGVVKLNIRIREFEKPWLFHVLADLEYPCILGIDFIGGSKIILDFNRKSLAISGSRINKVVKTAEVEKVEIDLSKTKLEEKQKRELQGIMSALDLRLGYFHMVVNPSDIVKTGFVTKNGTYGFRRMPYDLSGAAPNFQKAIDIILKPVIGKIVNVYMDDVIISSPSFPQYVKHLKEVFR
ncbi:uncharacterized protein TNCV_4371281 [Trichonephila clavipes]|nr:uncharacterized protein TNCV_4371281 [Trichonephila clavipes]